MVNDIDVKTFDITKFAEAITREASEAVKWERRKLEWILEEKDREGKKEAA